MTNSYPKTALLVALLAVALLSGCKEKEGAPAAAEAEPVRERPTRDDSKAQEIQPEPESKKKSIIGRIFSADTSTPPYGWDGHCSTHTFNISADAAYNRTLD